MRELSEIAELTILTARMAGKTGKKASGLKKAIKDWLEDNSIPFDAIHTGVGKPVAHAYIDDRGVACRPEEDGLSAFKTAMLAVKGLV